jgi:hypothetical protein
MSKSKRKPSAKPAQHRSKREQFEEAGRFPVKKAVIAGVVVVVIAVGAFVGIRAYENSVQAGGPVVSQGGADYARTSLDMSPLTSSQETGAGMVTLSVAELTSKKIGGFVYSRSTPMPKGYDSIQGNGLPLLAYVAPSGRLVVATSMCEPCRSYDFHIEGNQLVCNTCLTRWDLNTLKGVSGGCLDYPPKEVTTVVQGDVIQIQQSELEAWVPRI